MKKEMRQALILWFKKNRRSLPWREKKEAYRVWISEIMLQQTRVEAVLSYYNQWMEKFPSVHDLAEASLAEVIKAWEGLGYYSRARNIHQTAKIIVQKLQGVFPFTKKELLLLPGIGSYTAGAILLFAFQRRSSAVDGNVMRVFCRFFCIEKDIQKQKTKKEIEEKMSKVLQLEEEFVLLAESFIELGALICKKQPLCSDCPLSAACRAHQKNIAGYLPINSKKQELIKKNRIVLLIQHKDLFLIKKNEKKGLMQDLYEFVYFDDYTTLHSSICKQLPGALHMKKRYPKTKQFYTKYAVSLFPYHVLADKKFSFSPYQWVALDCLKQLPFSSSHSKLVQTLIQENR